jgi:hypothetical protein
MPRRPANVNQADVRRVLRACKHEDVPVRIVLRPDGCAVFETLSLAGVPTAQHDVADDLDRELAEFQKQDAG